MTLLREIQAGALDSKVDLSDTLRKCKMLAARLKNQEFADWVNGELNGYNGDAELPPYRKSKTQSFGHFQGPYGSGMRDAIIPASSLPEDLEHHVTDLEFHESVGQLLEIHQNMQRNSGTARINWNPDVIAHIQHQRIKIYSHDTVLIAAYKVVPSVTVKGILETVRNRILDFTTAVEIQAPEAGESNPSQPPPLPPQIVQHIYKTTIINGQANIGTQGNASITTGPVTYNGIPPESQDEVRELVGKLKQEIVEAEFEDADEGKETKADASEALAKVETQLVKDTPDGNRVMAHLKFIASIVTTVAPTINTLITLLQRLGLM